MLHMKHISFHFKKIFFGALILCALSNFVTINAHAYSLVISEIMYDASGSDSGKEWVEIKNIGNGTVNIVPGSGAGSFRFYDGSNHYLSDPTMGSLNIAPGEFLVVAQATSTFMTSYPAFSGNLTKSAINLNNTSATLKIIDGNGNTLDEVIYQNAWGGNGNGKSLSKINLAGENTSSGWQDSSQVGGTPGQENTFSTPNPPPSISPLPSPSPSAPPTSPSPLFSPTPSPMPSPSAIHSLSPSFVPSPSYSAPPSASLSPTPQITPIPSLAYPHYTYPSFPPIGGPLSSQDATPSPKTTNTNNNGSLLNIYNVKSGSSSSINLSATQTKFSDKLKNLFSSNKLFQKFSSLPQKTMFWGFVVAGVSAAAAFFLFLKI